MQPTEPKSSHAPALCVTPTECRREAWPEKENSSIQEIPVALVTSDATFAPTHQGLNQPFSVVPNGDVEKGFGIEERSVSLRSISDYVKVPLTAGEDEGKGFEDWLKMEKPPLKDLHWVIVMHKAKQLFFVIVLVVPSIVLCYLFSLLVKDVVQQWHDNTIAPLQKNPIVAGLIGEPFHKLKSISIYGTFAALAFLCPYLCCQTKMLVHLLFMYGRQMLPVWRMAMATSTAMAAGNLAAAVVMQQTRMRVPRIAWMGIIFSCLFTGLFLCARQASRILGFPGFTWLYFRASFLANVLLYLYAVFFPFWFFGTDSLAAKLILATAFHPTVEYCVGFLFQHTAVQLRHNDPNTSINPGFHYGTLFALYGAFLLVNCEEAWQNILGFSLLRAWTVFSKVFAQELTYCTYVLLLRKKPDETVRILSTVRFKRYRNDVINTGFLVESVSIIVAGAVTFLFRFNKSAEGAEEATASLGETLSVVGLQVVIGMLCDAAADAGLAYRGLPWHNAWQTQQRRMLPKLVWIVFVAVGMFLFYFYPFLASHMVLQD